MPPFTLALAQYPIEKLHSLLAWKDKIAHWVDQAASVGAKLLVFPEYASMELASLDPQAMGDLGASLRFVAALRQSIDGHHAMLAARHGVYIVAGSMPVPLEDGRIVNRARIFAPSRGMSWQDKIVMTRFEREQWGISGGDTIRAFRTSLGIIGISICYDVEFPLIARAQAEAGAHLILAPSCTDTMQGYHRVRIGAQARALENQLFVAQTPTVGMAPWSPVLDENYGAAGLFGPPDGDVPHDGVIDIGPMNEGRWLLTDVDPERVTSWRQDGAVRPYAHWTEQLGRSSPPPALPVELVNLT